MDETLETLFRNSDLSVPLKVGVSLVVVGIKKRDLGSP